MPKKIYDFKMEKVKTKLVTTFKHNKKAATLADLMTLSGLPKYQVEQGVKVVADEYGGHMKVTDSGEILYYFPSGMNNKTRGFLPSCRKWLKQSGQALKTFFTLLFKAWIMVMLVGYFILFAVILVAAVVAAIAASSASKERNRSRGGGLGSFFIVARILEIFLRIFFYVQLTEPRQGQRKEKGKPFYKSVFAFVFGDVDPNQGWSEYERLAILKYIRSHKGVITAEELMAMSGRNLSEVQSLVNRLLLEYEGEPQVTENGTLIYFFPELLKTRKGELGAPHAAGALFEDLVPFSSNAKKTNGWIIFYNAFNLFFGTYFVYFSFANPLTFKSNGFSFVYAFLYRLLYTLDNPQSLLLISLGLVPLVFSLLFFVIPLLRNFFRKRRNEKIKRDNFKKRIFSQVLANPATVDPSSIHPARPEEQCRNADSYLRKQLDYLAAEKSGDVEEQEDGGLIYKFPELERELKDLEGHRAGIDLSQYEVGKTVFDTNEPL